MQLTLGRKGDYSIRAMLEVARRGQTGRVKSREIAEAMRIPERYLPQILANLVRHGLLTAVAGPDGGYALSRPPAEVTLLDVVEASEGPLLLEHCILRGGRCEWENVCPMHLPWRRAQDALMAELRGTTFEELARLDAAIAGGEAGVAGAPGHRAQSRARRPQREGDSDD